MKYSLHSDFQIFAVALIILTACSPQATIPTNTSLSAETQTSAPPIAKISLTSTPTLTPTPIAVETELENKFVANVESVTCASELDCWNGKAKVNVPDAKKYYKEFFSALMLNSGVNDKAVKEFYILTDLTDEDAFFKALKSKNYQTPPGLQVPMRDPKMGSVNNVLAFNIEVDPFFADSIILVVPEPGTIPSNTFSNNEKLIQSTSGSGPSYGLKLLECEDGKIRLAVYARAEEGSIDSTNQLLAFFTHALFINMKNGMSSGPREGGLVIPKLANGLDNEGVYQYGENGYLWYGTPELKVIVLKK